MTYLSINDLTPWASPDSDKLSLDTVDADRDKVESALVLSKLSGSFDISSWVDSNTTPLLVKSVMAMYYVADYIDSVYLEDSDLNDWAALLRSRADLVLSGIIAGSIIIPEVPVNSNKGLDLPDVYPNDLSTASEPTYEDYSLGPEKFSMGRIF